MDTPEGETWRALIFDCELLSVNYPVEDTYVVLSICLLNRNPQYRAAGISCWKDEYAARGVFGQLIQVNPTEHLVIATHSASDKAGSTAYYAHQGGFVRAVVAYFKNH